MSILNVKYMGEFGLFRATIFAPISNFHFQLNPLLHSLTTSYILTLFMTILNGLLLSLISNWIYFWFSRSIPINGPYEIRNNNSTSPVAFILTHISFDHIFLNLYIFFKNVYARWACRSILYLSKIFKLFFVYSSLDMFALWIKTFSNFFSIWIFYILFILY